MIIIKINKKAKWNDVMNKFKEWVTSQQYIVQVLKVAHDSEGNTHIKCELDDKKSLVNTLDSLNKLNDEQFIITDFYFKVNEKGE